MEVDTDPHRVRSHFYLRGDSDQDGGERPTGEVREGGQSLLGPGPATVSLADRWDLRRRPFVLRSINRSDRSLVLYSPTSAAPRPSTSHSTRNRPLSDGLMSRHGRRGPSTAEEVVGEKSQEHRRGSGPVDDGEGFPYSVDGPFSGLDEKRVGPPSMSTGEQSGPYVPSWGGVREEWTSTDRSDSGRTRRRRFAVGSLPPTLPVVPRVVSAVIRG